MRDQLVITASAVFFEQTDERQSADLMRRATAALLALGDVQFEEDSDRQIYEKPGRPWTDGPVFFFDRVSDSAFMLRHYWRKSSTHYLVVAPDVAIERSDLRREWLSLVRRIEAVVMATTPDIGFAWARTSEGPDPIDERKVSGSTMPEVITPWTFIGDSVLTSGTRDSDAATPPWITRTPSGFLIAPVQVPGDAPDKQLESWLKEFGVPAYVDPLRGEL